MQSSHSWLENFHRRDVTWNIEIELLTPPLKGAYVWKISETDRSTVEKEFEILAWVGNNNTDGVESCDGYIWKTTISVVFASSEI